MKILALVLARGGSKRLKKKNIIKLKNKPLIFWTIKFARKLPYVASILVSTDDKKIANFAKLHKAFVPWLRPKVLSRDKISSASAALHALKWYENHVQQVDGMLLLQPTSPFRNLKIFKKIINSYKKNFNKNYISVSKSKSFNISKNFKKNNNIRNNYIPNGCFYLISPKKFKKFKTFTPKDSIGVILKNKKEQIDIDYKSDLEFAKSFI